MKHSSIGKCQTFDRYQQFIHTTTPESYFVIINYRTACFSNFILNREQILCLAMSEALNITPTLLSFFASS